MKRATTMPLLLAMVTAACGAARTPGAEPGDMSAAGHEHTALSEERIAAAHRARYDPQAGVDRERCGTADQWVPICWTSTSNPTAEHLEAAKRHRKMAADHRAASAALRDAEARSCVGISELDRDMSPFAHREDIASVEPLVLETPTKNVTSKRSVGAVVTFRAVPGMTAQWLQRVVDCHLARNAALGHDVPEMPYCPLVPKGVTASVTATQTGFAVAIRGEDESSSQEVLRRAHTLVGR